MLVSAWLKGKSIVTYAVLEHCQLFIEALLRGAVVTNQFETNSPEYTQRYSSPYLLQIFRYSYTFSVI